MEGVWHNLCLITWQRCLVELDHMLRIGRAEEEATFGLRDCRHSVRIAARSSVLPGFQLACVHLFASESRAGLSMVTTVGCYSVQCSSSSSTAPIPRRDLRLLYAPVLHTTPIAVS